MRLSIKLIIFKAHNTITFIKHPTMATAPQKVIDSIAFLVHLHGRNPADRKEVAFHSGLPARAFTNACLSLKRARSIRTPNKNEIAITKQGRLHANTNARIHSNRELLERAKGMVSGKSKDILELLKDGEIRSRVVVGKIIGVDASCRSFRSLMFPIENLGFVASVDGEDNVPSLQMTDMMFSIDGRP